VYSKFYESCKFPTFGAFSLWPSAVGATFVGRDAVELLQASTMAIFGGLTLEQIWHVTPPFPTMSEIYTILSEAAEV
jgi:hypothetical protein